MFDLHAAFVKKQEYECARLDEFLFRHRARTIRRLAEWARSQLTGKDVIDVTETVGRIVDTTDVEIIDLLHRKLGTAEITREQLERRFLRERAVAHREMIAEFGDPTPHRLV